MVRPSNGTEGEAWVAAWCHSCENDHPDEEVYCSILMDGLLGGEPPEWHRGPLWSPQTVIYCTAYSPRPR